MIKCTFLGDIMCKEDLIRAFSSDKGYCFDELFSPMKKLFAQSDFVMGNLETPISYDDSNLTNTQYCFNSPYEFAEAVKNAGINAVATANNHCLDRGIAGIYSTVESLDEIGLIHTGCLSRDNPVVLKRIGGYWACFHILMGQMRFQTMST